MRFDIITIFPDFYKSTFEYGILGRARKTGLVELATHDLRSFTHDRHRTVDDRPFGGGEGMVLKPQPIFEAARAIGVQPKDQRDAAKETVILLSAQGRPFTQAVAQELSSVERVVMICGRYEGVDERVNQSLCDREISIGDYVISGGELAAAVIVDAVVRLLPGALGHPDSSRFESFGSEETDNKYDSDGSPRTTHGSGGILDYPHYTRPSDFEGSEVPEVLQGGNHDAIRAWRRMMALEKTLENRPELLEKARLSPEDRKVLEKLKRMREEAS
ncbi:MAG: tRNA (guanosine(37)-N1)-methyltransferase TrmD [Edaphobacter sp.]|uniref:tRNA (guanosine(37)-N1)-methyltransferase TrmD n=1 Tax=Edaphobacter sp. TaxID=1934404 RepID=UPI00238C10C9|nr:tRNA (guanosine(37)-N1)-methyltransferase TrmD [Edaphobacter sp.]MDE1175221.1 tRNA (guanosine(37)-N1)-methyltransferase TrmD [Edaphobacter sp.]